jgi:poly-beta-1,6-N-acetyl-D-glucosamine biosynthesis protein PgaD
MNIVDGCQKKSVKLIESLITAAGWAFLLTYFIQVTLSVALWAFNLSNFYHKLLILTDIKTTIYTLLITIMISVLACLVIYFWGRYNFKRYAHLNRRKFPKEVSSQDIIEYFNLSPEIVEYMQNNKNIQLEKTIV